MDGEMRGPATETMSSWWSRFEWVDNDIRALGILRPIEVNGEEGNETKGKKKRSKGKSANSDYNTLTSLPSLNASIAGSSTVPLPNTSHTPRLNLPSPSSIRRLYRRPQGSRSNAEERSSFESIQSSISGRFSKSSSHHHQYSSDDRSRLASTSTHKWQHDRARSMPVSPSIQPPRRSSRGRSIPHSLSSSLQSLTTSEPFTRDQEPYILERRRTGSSRPTPSPAPSQSPSTSSYRNKALLTPSRGLSPPTPTSSQASVSAERAYSKLPAMYTIQVVHACTVPSEAIYREFPFFSLAVDEKYDVLQEAGHPLKHPGLPLDVNEEEEDCLLLSRNSRGEVGWVLASFVILVD